MTPKTPNHGPRRKGATLRWLVWHCDASPSESATLSWIANPKSQVSYHWLIRRDGRCERLVPDDRAAWAVGVSEWEGVTGLNSWSVSIAFANRNDGKEPLTPEQIAAGKALRLQYPTLVSLTHAQVAMPRGRKTDPDKAPNFRLSDFQ